MNLVLSKTTTLKLQAVWKLGMSLERGSHGLEQGVPDLIPAEQSCLKAVGVGGRGVLP